MGDAPESRSARTAPPGDAPDPSAVPGTQPGSGPTALDRELAQIVAGRHSDPHRLLGLHDGVVRAYRPDAVAMRVVIGEQRLPMARVRPEGLFEAPVPDAATAYRLEADYGRPGMATTFVFDDPYRAWPTVGDVDLHLFGEGRHRRLWEVLGAHARSHREIAGASFAVWAPNAQAVRVVGDWNFWDGRVHAMRSLGESGVWELFIPGVAPGARYKYELVAADGRLIQKADPFAFATEVPPGTASVIGSPTRRDWTDGPWISERARRDTLASPTSVYEVHLGSWRWVSDARSGHVAGHGTEGRGGWRPMTYRELAEHVPAYVADLGFTHVELMPVAEHPFGGSWGYQVSAYYAPTARYGSPDDFRALVDAFHGHGIGVIVDWVPAHFPRDEFALARFDGTALYEHDDPRKGTQPDWGTLVFNFGRNEVRNFLVANALYWLEEFHIDGLRVDAVASMLYLDYSRPPGEWIPNQFGGRENLEAIAFLREVNATAYRRQPGIMMIAEESTAWPGVTRPVHLGGLGFGFKWNMGWMNDTLAYLARDPVYRQYHQNELTFSLVYAFSENYILPLSHDEVVHGKGSLLGKMPGDDWRRFAGLRALLAYMWAHPGKQLLFMGSEFGQGAEWSEERGLDWWVLGDPDGYHSGVQQMVSDMNGFYRSAPALWALDTSPEGFSWIDANDAAGNTLSFLRFAAPPSSEPVPVPVPTWLGGGQAAGAVEAAPATGEADEAGGAGGTAEAAGAGGTAEAAGAEG